jgi:hypothetical protein
LGSSSFTWRIAMSCTLDSGPSRAQAATKSELQMIKIPAKREDSLIAPSVEESYIAGPILAHAASGLLPPLSDEDDNRPNAQGGRKHGGENERRIHHHMRSFFEQTPDMSQREQAKDRAGGEDIGFHKKRSISASDGHSPGVGFDRLFGISDFARILKRKHRSANHAEYLHAKLAYHFDYPSVTARRPFCFRSHDYSTLALFSISNCFKMER